MSDVQVKLRSFESQIAYMNGLYKLPLAPYPTTYNSLAWQKAHGTFVIQTMVENGQTINDKQLVIDRVGQFMKVLGDELNEGMDIIQQLHSTDKDYQEIDYLVDMADWCGDMIVYCASEMQRLGIPIMAVLKIIMDSNFSKLDAEGKPIIKDGKFEKGPFYWKPEPKIKELLLELIAEHTITTTTVTPVKLPSGQIVNVPKSSKI